MASVREPLSASRPDPKGRTKARHDDVDLARDRALVERCQAGDERAFEDLYLRYRDRLHRFCMRRTSNAEEAEDIVQEAFARAWKALSRFDGERRFYPWLSVIANNLCTDLARKGGRCTPVEESTLEFISPAVAAEQESLVDATGEGQMLAEALGRISARHREVLELREAKNWSYQEIASHAGVEVSTIETLLFRARRSLKREFLTIARAETGLAGALVLPLVAFRKLLRKLHSPFGQVGAKLSALVSAVPGAGATVAGGAAVAIAAAAVTAGAAMGAHPGAASSAGTPASRLAAAQLAAGAAGQGHSASGRGGEGHSAGSASRGAAGASRRRGGHGSTSTARSTAGSAHSSGTGTGAAAGAVNGIGGAGIAGGGGGTVTKAAAGAGGTVHKVLKGVEKAANPVTGSTPVGSTGVSGTVSAISTGVSSIVSGITGSLP